MLEFKNLSFDAEDQIAVSNWIKYKEETCFMDAIQIVENVLNKGKAY